MSFIKGFAKTVTQYVKDSIKLKSLSKDDIEKIIDGNMEAHRNIINILKTLSKSHREAIVEGYETNMKESKVPTGDLLKLYKKGLNNKCMGLERKKPFESMIAANKVYLLILDGLRDKLDDLIKEERITIFNTRMSYLAILGLLRQSDFYGDYTCCFWDMIAKVYHDEDVNTIPGYKRAFLTKHMGAFINLTNNVNNRKGKYSFVNDLETMAKKNHNTLLYSNKKTADTVVNFTSFGNHILDILYWGLGMLNVFYWAGVGIDDWQHKKYKNRLATKRWMENRVALLKLEIEEKDMTGKKKADYENIIKNYESEIARHQQAIDKYEKDMYEE